MKLQRKVSVLLSVLLLLGSLAGCERKPVIADIENSDKVAFIAGMNDPLNVAPPVNDNGVKYDPAHRLEVELPEVLDGELELPVQGATGYASIALPLWKNRPGSAQANRTAATAEKADVDALIASLGSSVSARRLSSGEGSDSGMTVPDTVTPPSTVDTGTAEPPSPPPTDTTTPTTPDNNNHTGDTTDTTPPSGGATDPADGEDDAPNRNQGLLDWLQGNDGEDDKDKDDKPVSGHQTQTPVTPSGASTMLEAGTPFTVLQEVGNYWFVKVDDMVGWVEHKYCFINLPDVIPSIVYNATNGYSSVFRSSGKDIPGITGTALYTGTTYNERLGGYEFMMPTLYAMAKRLCQAQQAALREGNTIVLYEAFRPYEIQRAVSQELHLLTQKDSEVRAGVYSSPWSIDWFINTSVSNHQMGYAVDISMAKVTKSEVAEIAGRQVVQVLNHTEYTMPTPIHELSRAAATYTRPFSPNDTSRWKTATMTATFAACEPVLAMHRYCTAYGLTPLASEWWHFNDLNALKSLNGNTGNGRFYIEKNVSMTPEAAQKILEQVA